MNNLFFSNDPQISSIVEDLVESVAKIDQAAPILIAKLVPYLTTALATKEDVLESNGDTSITNTFISTCLDITTRLVRYLPKPIPGKFYIFRVRSRKDIINCLFCKFSRKTNLG